jgi:hypothetical protein
MAFFIPWRVVAEESGAAHFDLLGAPAAPAPIFILVLHRALPDLQRMKHKPDQAFGHRQVVCFFLVIFRFGATMELGRSERTTMRPLWSYRVDGADTPDRKPR